MTRGGKYGMTVGKRIVMPGCAKLPLGHPAKEISIRPTAYLSDLISIRSRNALTDADLDTVGVDIRLQERDDS